MTPKELPAHITSSAFCVFATIMIAFQVCRNPNKIRLYILCYSILALPSSIVNTLTVSGTLDQRTDSLVYLASTLFMTVAHFSILLDVGYRLRIGETTWKNPTVIVGIVFLSFSGILLIVQIIYLAVNPDGKQQYPLAPCFIAGFVTSVVGNLAVFIYGFKPLIYWRENRTNEGLSRITALGIWFFLAQNAWYVLFAALYIWFFVKSSWSYFPTMLGFDYALRYVEIVIYTWPPPKWVIASMTSRLPNSAMSTGKKSSNNTSSPTNNVMSSERYNKEENVEYGTDGCELTVRSEQRSVNSHNEYGSKVTIVTR